MEQRYDPLLDPHLRGWLSGGAVQQTLVKQGLIDREGRIFVRASPPQASSSDAAAAAALAREESALRERVRALRLKRLDEEQRARKVALVREGAQIRAEISRISREINAPCEVPSGGARAAAAADSRRAAPPDGGASLLTRIVAEAAVDAATQRPVPSDEWLAPGEDLDASLRRLTEAAAGGGRAAAGAGRR